MLRAARNRDHAPRVLVTPPVAGHAPSRWSRPPERQDITDHPTARPPKNSLDPTRCVELVASNSLCCVSVPGLAECAKRLNNQPHQKTIQTFSKPHRNSKKQAPKSKIKPADTEQRVAATPPIHRPPNRDSVGCDTVDPNPPLASPWTDRSCLRIRRFTSASVRFRWFPLCDQNTKPQTEPLDITHQGRRMAEGPQISATPGAEFGDSRD